MKQHLLILAAPLLAVACGQNVTKADGEAMPAPTPINSADKDTKKADKAPEIQVTEVKGAWEKTDTPRGQQVAYLSEDGEVSLSITCQEPDAFAGEDGQNVLVLRRTFAGKDAPSQVGVFTSASNAAIVAQVDEESQEIVGMFDTRSTAANALANGDGDLRFVAGQSAYVMPTDPMVEELIETCRPPIESNLEGANTENEEEAEAPSDSGT
ncbi:hypothetical protein [Hyphomonas pacifica]|uniref:Uncharacterized protein n=1 Tax=Hyphomonas pacifica TaxID=1280941 RepID=A0A062U6D4_9PROT|nr:hypothetical protein [Hyphomonas pacifica]KCZ51685.1 hypothetical protein HY2_01660 [Hyphomonas pacifica]RAN34354.1 hypothetical protein HY3_01745 [Hyphomonas pacifica]